jgi:hypothetical protein
VCRLHVGRICGLVGGRQNIKDICAIDFIGRPWRVSRGRTPLSTILYDIYCLMLLGQ